MKNRVIVTDNAKANLRSYYSHAAKRAPLTAERWLNLFEKALATLASNPERCARAPENDLVAPEIGSCFSASRRASIARCSRSQAMRRACRTSVAVRWAPRHRTSYLNSHLDGTAPDDLEIDPDKPHDGLGQFQPGLIMA